MPTDTITSEGNRRRTLLLSRLAAATHALAPTTRNSLVYHLRRFSTYITNQHEVPCDLIRDEASWIYLTVEHVQAYLRWLATSEPTPADNTLVSTFSVLRVAARVGLKAGLLSDEIAEQLTSLSYDTMSEVLPKMPDEEFAHYFWQHIDKPQGEEGCWFWNGARHKGVGRVRRGLTLATAYRVAWELTHNEKLQHVRLVRRCSSTDCCNPQHWQRFVTAAARKATTSQRATETKRHLQQLLDRCVSLARSAPATEPQPLGQNKLTRPQVATMKLLINRLKPALTNSRIAAAFKISRQMLETIDDGISWADVRIDEAPADVRAAIDEYIKTDPTESTH